MVKYNFDNLNITFQKRYKNKGFKMKENTGIDTETYKGYCKLICSNDGKYDFIESFEDVTKFLCHRRFKDKYNWFFNIQFDFEAIIKYLDYADLITLYQEKEVLTDGGILVKYIPSKSFTLKDKHNHNYYFYDIHSFLEGSLNKLSKELLNDSKIDIIDGNELNTNLDYWEKNKEDIIKYCIKDADLTKRIADYFWQLFYDNLKFYPKQPISKGKLSEEYFLHTCNVPQINYINEKVMKYAYQAYYGGHFEILKRGYFDKVYSYDIKSAYPASIRNLPDYNLGIWKKVHNLNKDAYTGFYHCKVFILEKNFSPCMQKTNGNIGLNCYPNGHFHCYLAKKEIEFITDNFPNAQIKIENGYEFYPKELKFPFKEEIERLYAWKEKEQNKDVKYCVKILMNSLYGKFIQISKSNLTTGKLFNPIYACEITAETRIKLLNMALQKPDCIISFATDGVTSTEPLTCPNNPQLGDFGKEFEGQGVFIQSGVYNLWNEETKKVINKMRGFNIASVKDYDSSQIYLKDILESMDNTKYVYYTKRPDHLGECIAHRKTKTIIDNLNVFSEHEKTIDINGDNKRVWNKDFEKGKDCLKEQHNSMPLLLGVM